MEVWVGFLLQRFRVGSPKASRTSKVQKKHEKHGENARLGLAARWRDILAGKELAQSKPRKQAEGRRQG